MSKFLIIFQMQIQKTNLIRFNVIEFAKECEFEPIYVNNFVVLKSSWVKSGESLF